MRLRGKIALGGGLASAATATWLVTAGVLATSATLVALDPVAPRAEARALTPFDSCASLLDWYVDAAVKDVGPYGWDHGYLAYGGVRREMFLADTATAAGSTPVSAMADAVSSSATGTNTQEASVDEPDVAKTDGTLLARIADDKALVLLDVSGRTARELGRLRLPGNGYGSELLLAGDHVLITQQVYDEAGDPRTDDLGATSYRVAGRPLTRLLDVDISNRAAPRLRSQDRYTGLLLSARQYGDTVRLVTSTGRPELRWTHPSKKVSEQEATRRNRALVRRTPISAWLPSVARGSGPEVPIDCSAVLHPEKYAGNDTVVVTTFPATDPGARSTAAVTAGGGIVYSSADRLYVATTEYATSALRDLVGRPGSMKQTTSLHAFDLTGEGTTYVGSGSVDGSLRDRWSLDEYDGHLRVAWTRTSDQGRTRNGITVLTERDGALVPTGSLGNLGIDEDIQSVRWFDDLAVLVTFRRTDPLYTVDLTDPDRPELLGALKIPGFSGYLHPIGDDLLLGLGMSGDEDGLTGGAQAAVFDISDLRDPVQVSRESFRTDTYLPAIDDPRGFTWVEASGTGITPVSNWTDGSARMVALEVSDTGKLSSRTLTDLGSDWQARSFDLPGDRVAVLDGNRVLLLQE